MQALAHGPTAPAEVVHLQCCQHPNSHTWQRVKGYGKEGEGRRVDGRRKDWRVSTA